MDLNEVKKLIKLVERSDITEIEIFEKGQKIRISKNGSKGVGTHIAAPAVQTAPAPVSGVVPAVGQAIPEAVAANILEIRSPMVGTFYRAPSPDAESYVRVGDAVEPGKALCIIEAMKLMNEIEAEVAGKIVEILVENGQAVEYDQVLFRVEVKPAR
jgi:acetyl-CoA carboxylase biotin carboxyl carrier protein